ncbi:MAG: PTS sugar transporter subunit IIC, partial [Lactococcus lactis]|nr:PTS sugar transporter subunit IIC [Lactococcus lactis]
HNLDRHSTQILGKVTILWGALAGWIMGDFSLGLQVGAILQLMSLGVANIGGSSMPDYTVAAIISATIAVSTGEGMAAGLAIGVPVGMLVINFDVLVKLFNSFIGKKAQTYANEKEFTKMTRTIPVSTFIYPLEAAVPVFIAITFGRGVVEGILNFMPDWFTEGLNVAGGMLPAVGIAILLVYMPMKKYGFWILVGFVLTAFLELPVLGVALIGTALGIHQFKQSTRKSKLAGTSAQDSVLSEEDMEDE